MNKINYEVDVLVNGHSVQEYFKDGKVYIEGRKKQKFSIRIKNNGYSKILAIPTIDGLSVIDGKEAGYSSPGYIINGYDSITINGWRTSNKEIAEFYFTNPKDSYSQKTGKKNNLGVIGVAIFREKQSHITPTPFPEYPYPKYPYPKWPMYDVMSNVNMSMVNDVAESDLGTGFGEYKKSEVIEANFDKESNPDTVFEIYYNSREQLEKIGIDFHSRPNYISPQAFPNGFCESPK